MVRNSGRYFACMIALKCAGRVASRIALLTAQLCRVKTRPPDGPNNRRLVCVQSMTSTVEKLKKQGVYEKIRFLPLEFIGTKIIPTPVLFGTSLPTMRLALSPNPHSRPDLLKNPSAHALIGRDGIASIDRAVAPR